MFEALSSTVVYAGSLGTAKVMKLANNMVAALLKAALAEASTLITARAPTRSSPRARWSARGR